MRGWLTAGVRAASKLRYCAASKLRYRVASKLRYCAASKLRYRAASKLRYRAASKLRYRAASKLRYLLIPATHACEQRSLLQATVAVVRKKLKSRDEKRVELMTSKRALECMKIYNYKMSH